MSGWRAFPAISHVVQRRHIDRYAELSGDANPLHMDADYARAAGFDDVIAHGPIGVQTIFEAVATWLDEVPAGVRIDVLYRGPVGIGDTITCRAAGVDDHAGDLVVRVVATNQDDAEVLQGLVVVPRSVVPRAG